MAHESTLDVGSTHVTVREASGRVRIAKILEKRIVEGRMHVLVDRIAHEKWGKIRGWKAGGCYVTEFVSDSTGYSGVEDE